jgi:hypothetical protein
MTDAINLVGIEKKHLIRIGEDLVTAGMFDEYACPRKDDLRHSDLLFAAQSTVCGTATDIGDRNQRPAVANVQLKVSHVRG